jgi:hypothetical protein
MTADTAETIHEPAHVCRALFPTLMADRTDA